MSSTRMVNGVLGIPLTTPTATAVFAILTVIGLIVLLLRRYRVWFAHGVPLAVTAALGSTVVAALLIEKVWKPFPDRLPWAVYGWAATALLAVSLLIGRWFVRRRDRARPLVATALVVSAVLVVISAAGRIDAVYDAYPTVRTVLGISDYRTVPFDDPSLRASQTVPVEDWSASDDLPATGAVTSVTIPGTVSGFRAREARVYLPPAYFSDPRPELPVLVLLAGQPGSPEDWLVGGHLPSTMDAYAAQHHGLAPVVVLADGTGGQFDNPLCADSHLGNVATYLAVDVPAWVRDDLQVDDDPRARAVGGLSYGGTCALQLATTRPDVYPTFLDMSGQAEPTIGDRASTIRDVFGGDAEAFARNNPADLLARNRYPDSAGAFVVGLDDSEYRAGVEQLASLARSAGMDVHLTELPGTHSFALWSAGLEKELPWLAQRLGLGN
ncbi:esterase family protein [Rhodococcus pyridinivorans]|nr:MULTISPECIES: alpha/beta hydrolase-fold protein [Rhodococcus]AWZ23356.1 esterase [Rhodococcus pyridinivorans]MCD2117113.1 esterase family protein [Rhodococcus pyridinivorans]MCT7291559.1 esterase family protein [Rhodococcus sp. PAE-6]MCZ4626234.1 alpha/beta hydrolase-fold protein [Rhodococcus pyridinivorans]MCZ4647189.1 alpha/beta hydrolase-fold protein [Rhodococcus pyridinivorans]